MATPKVDKQFWFNYSEEIVKGSTARLDKAIDSVKSFTTGLLTLYTVSAIFTIEYKDIENIYLIILFSLPYIIVLFGQWHATSSTIPKSVIFDPRIPDDIREAHNEIHEYKSKRLKISLWISLAATMLVAITLMLGFILGNQKIKEDKQKKEIGYKAVYDKESKSLLVIGHFPKESKISVILTHYFNKDTVIRDTATFLTSDDGYFSNAIKMDTIGKRSEIHIEWNENDTRHALTRKIQEEP